MNLGFQTKVLTQRPNKVGKQRGPSQRKNQRGPSQRKNQRGPSLPENKPFTLFPSLQDMPHFKISGNA